MNTVYKNLEVSYTHLIIGFTSIRFRLSKSHIEILAIGLLGEKSETAQVTHNNYY